MAKFKYLATTETGTEARGSPRPPRSRRPWPALVEQGFDVSQLKREAERPASSRSRRRSSSKAS